jgi:hypothetical protein
VRREKGEVKEGQEQEAGGGRGIYKKGVLIRAHPSLINAEKSISKL